MPMETSNLCTLKKSPGIRVISVVFGAFLLFALTEIQSDAQKIQYRETVVAGSPEKFAEVRHVILKGSNFEIGKKIGEIAKRDGVTFMASETPIINRAKREYMARNYPIHFERMRGVADAFGLKVADDLYDFTALFQKQFKPPLAGPGCSVIFYPADFTESGHNILSRNYDFTTGDMNGLRPKSKQMAIMSQPYLIEIHPDRGYSSLSICALDYLGGVLEGINSEGLAVSILSESESGQKVGYEPGNEAGLYELLSMRYLLDNCKNVEEAKEALLFLKHYYCFLPLHYIIADRSGKSFIFEFSPARNRSYLIDGNGPQFITNHMVYLHQKVEEFPETGLSWSMTRYKKLHESIKAKSKFSLEDISAIANSVAIPLNAPGNPERAWSRTLWYSQWDLDNLTMSVKFYLGESPDPANEKMVIPEYSPIATYHLKK
jgi:predicted choloylglycine hydrolase